MLHKRVPVISWLTTAVVWGLACLLLLCFGWLVSDVVVQGSSALSWSFLTTEPAQAGRAGGIAPLIVSTLLVLFVCLAVALPVGLGAAIWLSGITVRNNRLAQLVRGSLDLLAGMPSIVMGLFGNIFFCQILGFGFSLLSGGLTLACMVLPLLIRTTEHGLREIRLEYRLGSAALGFSQLTTLVYVFIPLAIPSIISGVILGIGRALAETAALIFTSGYVDRYPESLFDSGRVLSLHIYDLSMNVAGGDRNAYASALVLLALVFIMNELSGWLAHYYQRKRLMIV